ncbi:MAG: Nramp family divalent metal transporter [Gemmatimonadaceae bacterium]
MTSTTPPAGDHATVPPESRSGLDAWVSAELPEPPRPTGTGWLRVVGPGVIVLGLSIGSGEFLLGPATFVRHGLSLLWVAGVAIFLQTIFNLELMRYTVATGEPAFTGFMRTRPSAKGWAIVYALLYFLQTGWPAWAATAAGAIFFLFTKRLATAPDASIVYYIGVASFLVSVTVLLFGRRIERTLELLNWAMVTCILGGFFVLAIVFVPVDTWLSAGAGFVGYDTSNARFDFLPSGVDFILLAALVGYAGGGGVANITLSNWARDKGYGMGERVGYIPAAVGGTRVNLAHTGFMFAPTEDGMRRWHGWWRIVCADQWGVFFTGAMLGIALPALLYVHFLPRGEDIRGLGIAAALAVAVGEVAGPLLAGFIAFLGAWLLIKTQLDSLEAMTRAVTDMLWTGSRRVRRWRGGDVRAVYYTVLASVAIWGMIALRLAQPIVLLQIGANVAGAVFVIASLHLLYINTTLLPPELRPPMWRRAALVTMAVFYGFFVTLSALYLVRGA